MISVRTPSDVVGWDWYDYHLEHFVKAYLEKVPDLLPEGHPARVEARKMGYGAYWYIATYFHKKNLLRLKAVWEASKKEARGCPILLAGRDVWLLEVLARMEGFPTTFRSDISSATKNEVVEDYSNHFLIDTGFKGSVPNALGTKRWKLISHYTMGTVPTVPVKKYDLVISRSVREFTNYRQIFPYATNQFTSLAGILESVPKYWNQAHIKHVDGAKFGPIANRVLNPLCPSKCLIEQELSPADTFRETAVIVRHVVESLFKRSQKAYV